MEIKDIITIILGSGVVSTLLGALFSFFKDQSSIKNEKLHQCIDMLMELYENIYKWYEMAFSNFNYAILVIDGVNDWNAYLDKTINNKVDFKPLKIEIVINIYFPKLKNAFDELSKLVIETRGFINITIKEDYERGGNISKYKSQIKERIRNCNHSFEKLEKSIMETSKDMSRKYGVMK